MSHLITTVRVPVPQQGAPSPKVPVERPEHKLMDHEWSFVSLTVDEGIATIVWRETRNSRGQQCPDCTNHLGPPYGEGFKLTCTCGRVFTSGINRQLRLFMWERANS
jgi:hypothetical protein